MQKDERKIKRGEFWSFDYNIGTCAEDRATLESDLSAVTGNDVVGQSCIALPPADKVEPHCSQSVKLKPRLSGSAPFGAGEPCATLSPQGFTATSIIVC
jgi:hypothetical protein